MFVLWQLAINDLDQQTGLVCSLAKAESKWG
jgi:hypothetical protein